MVENRFTLLAKRDSLFTGNEIDSSVETGFTLQWKRDSLFTGQDLLSQRSERRAYGS
jgi:hypothetical protein